MFIINKKNNEANPVERKSFKDLGFSERKHLQEWIAKNPTILGEELLIIQKEFSDFDETNERLDLLALDKNGDLVIIENKLDDSGKDVTWQALKYVSYCSTLSKADVVQIFQKYLGTSKNAEQEICDFVGQEDFDEIQLNSGDQRIVFVAASFRKEVTSTVMWLLDHNIKIKCIKVTPYLLEDTILLDTEQIIPISEAEEFQIKYGNKKQEQIKLSESNQRRYAIRLKYWERLLKCMNEKTVLYSNVSPSKDNWIACGSGISGLTYVLLITGNFARIELWINKGLQDYNKKIFDNLHFRKERIETKFGSNLEWERLDEGKGSRIAFYLREKSVFNEADWEEMIEFMVSNVIKLEASLKDEIKTAIPNNK